MSTFVDRNLNTSVYSPSAKDERNSVPRFYFPNGEPVAPSENDAALHRAENAFSKLPSGTAERSCDLIEVCKAIGFPIYWKRPLFEAIAKAAGHPRGCAFDDPLPKIVFENFAVFWTELTSKAHDEASRFVFTLAASDAGGTTFTACNVREFLVHDDFISMLKDVIDTHPGMRFLAASPSFHPAYIQVVVSRIFWTLNRFVKGKLSIDEIRRSRLLETIRKVEHTDDINTVTEFFSYEQFYVIYSRFWDLDTDQDGKIDRCNLERYDDRTLTRTIVDRIFTVVDLQERGYMDLAEFTQFMMAEEDKRHSASIEYWFRCLDIDGDGELTAHVLRRFYEAMEFRMSMAGFEPLPFDNALCILFDMAKPEAPDRVTLGDLKRCGLAHRFLNTLVSVHKNCEQDSENGELTPRQDKSGRMSDWDLFCAVAYEEELAREF